MNLRRNLSADHENALIDLAPLIDVVFILLIFFMVSTTFMRESELEVTLPEASGQPSETKPDIIVTVDERGRYAVNGKVLINDQPKTLQRALQREMKDLENPYLNIKADHAASHRAVFTVMDVARQLGLSHVGLAGQFTQAEEESARDR